MGVVYEVCTECGDTYSDHEETGTCGGCESDLCGYCRDRLVEKYGECEDEGFLDYYGTGNPKECSDCTPTLVRDGEVLEYLLGLSGMSLSECKELILTDRGITIE